jgi:ABC-2 type transport system permease protein
VNSAFDLVKPRLWPLVHRRPAAGSRRLVRLGIITAVAGALWVGIFLVSLRVLAHFATIEEIGALLNFKLLNMLLVTSLALLVFSDILTALSKLYLARDLPLVHALPVPAHRIYLARWMEICFDGSWMVVAFTLPVFLAYGVVFGQGIVYGGVLAAALLPLALMAASLSSLLVMGAVILIPAHRMKNIFVMLGLLAFVAVYLALRLARPEQLVDPEVFDSVLAYVAALQTPSSPWLPSTWAYNALQAALDGAPARGLLDLALLWSGTGTLVFVSLLAAEALYYRGYSRTQAGAIRIRRGNSPARYRRRLAWSGPARALLGKELRTFWRDQTQWSQIFLILALVVIYVYNFKVLPLEKSPLPTVYLQNLLAFLNMGLALFVLTAVTARFAFPAVCAEREAFWTIKVAPVSIRAFLWIKFAIYYLPLLLLTETLIVATNLLLNVTPFMMGLSVLTVFAMVPGIVALGIGLGALNPNFRTENPAQAVTGFDGLLFMLFSTAFIGAVLTLQAGPVYRYFVAQLRGRPLPAHWTLWAATAGLLCLGLCIAAATIPMLVGQRRLEQRGV